MLQRRGRAERYRTEANRYAELAKTTAEPGFLINLYRQTAVRYVPMAEDLEKELAPRSGRERDGLSISLKDRADVFLRVS